MLLRYYYVRVLPIVCVVFNILNIPGYYFDPVFTRFVPALAVT